MHGGCDVTMYDIWWVVWFLAGNMAMLTAAFCETQKAPHVLSHTKKRWGEAMTDE